MPQEKSVLNHAHRGFLMIGQRADIVQLCIDATLVTATLQSYGHNAIFPTPNFIGIDRVKLPYNVRQGSDVCYKITINITGARFVFNK
jgi:hypothetical protein